LLTANLVISEFHYAPLPPTAAELNAAPQTIAADYEFIEVQNTHAFDSLALNGLELRDGVTFSFPAAVLAPQGLGVVVANPLAFRVRYGTSIPILGTFTGQLDNDGDRIELYSRTRDEVLLELNYSGGLIGGVRAAGLGASVELIDPKATSPSQISDPQRWRGSVLVHGTPRTVGPSPMGVEISEVRANTSINPNIHDAIELHNLTNQSIDISGWHISDDKSDYDKFRIRSGTIIAPDGYRVLNADSLEAAPGVSFDLDAIGGGLVLLTRTLTAFNFVDEVAFEGMKENETTIRAERGEGILLPVVRETLGCANAMPYVGPLVIREIHYNSGEPSDAARAVFAGITSEDLQYIELQNPTTSEIDLGGWRVIVGEQRVTLSSLVLNPGDSVALLTFDPRAAANASRLAAFRVHHGIGMANRVLLGLNAALPYAHGEVQLVRPDSTQAGVSYVVSDVAYWDRSLQWSRPGPGYSLQRRLPTARGDVARSWASGIASPADATATYGATITGDFDGDNVITATDIDMLVDAAQLPFTPRYFDLTQDGLINGSDLFRLLVGEIGTSPGDINLDGAVDGQDLAIWTEHLGQQCGAGWKHGDVTGDGRVDNADFQVWIDNRTLSYVVQEATSPVAVDGVVASGEWDSATEPAGHWAWPKNSGLDSYDNRLRMQWADEGLYVLYQTDYNDWASPSGDPDIRSRTDDVLELLFDPNNDHQPNNVPDSERDEYWIRTSQRDGVSRFVDGVLTNMGIEFSNRHKGIVGDPSIWSADPSDHARMEIVQRNSADGGVVELYLPWSMLNASVEELIHKEAPVEGETWYANIGQNVASDNDNDSYWGASTEFGAARPFGELMFNLPPQIASVGHLTLPAGTRRFVVPLSVVDGITTGEAIRLAISSSDRTVLSKTDVDWQWNVDQKRHELILTPNPGVRGATDLTVRAMDEHGASSTMTFQVTVVDRADILPDTYESNNSVPTAFALSSTDSRLTGATLHNHADIDWYRWTAPVRGDFQADVVATEDASDLGVQVYDAEGQLVGASSGVASINHVSVPVVAGQILYIKVYSASSTGGVHYELVTALTPPEPRLVVVAANQIRTFDMDGNAVGAAIPLGAGIVAGEIEVGPTGLLYVGIDRTPGVVGGNEIWEITPSGTILRMHAVPNAAHVAPAGFAVLEDASFLLSTDRPGVALRLYRNGAAEEVALDSVIPNAGDITVLTSGRIVFGANAQRVSATNDGRFWLAAPGDDTLQLYDASGQVVDERSVAQVRDVQHASNGNLFVLRGTALPAVSAISQYDPSGALLDVALMAGTITSFAVYNGENVVPVPRPDEDGDGLLDDWELFGLDIDGDGTIDLDLPALGADPKRKDLFVEVDAMVGREPVPLDTPCTAGTEIAPGVTRTCTYLDHVIESFLAAPVLNPDGSTGINLHLEYEGVGSLPVRNYAVTRLPDGSVDRWADFHADKEIGFASSVRGLANFAVLEEAKRVAYRYAIFADQLGDSFATGLAELPGNDFFVTLGPSQLDPSLTDDQLGSYQAGTFMHELGHALGLKHGGRDHVNFKPNYFSVMNYHWQIPNAMNLSWLLDYSTEALPTIDEMQLDERQGLFSPAVADGLLRRGLSGEDLILLGPYRTVAVPLLEAVDFNRDGDTDDSAVSADLNFARSDMNRDGLSNARDRTPGQLLHGSEDWSRLRFVFTDLHSFQRYGGGLVLEPYDPDDIAHHDQCFDLDPFEPNEFIATASTIGGTGETDWVATVDGATLSCGDVDWWRVELLEDEPAAYISVEVTPLTSEFTVRARIHEVASTSAVGNVEVMGVESSGGVIIETLKTPVIVGNSYYVLVWAEGASSAELDGAYSISLTVHDTLLPGDANLDDVVDVEDYQIWQQNNFGDVEYVCSDTLLCEFVDNSALGWLVGDFAGPGAPGSDALGPRDGTMDVHDFHAWWSQFSSNSIPAAAAVTRMPRAPLVQSSLSSLSQVSSSNVWHGQHRANRTRRGAVEEMQTAQFMSVGASGGGIEWGLKRDKKDRYRVLDKVFAAFG
jgi:hypothetical protein